MTQDVNFRGALTFDSEADLESALKLIQQKLEEYPNCLLTMDDILPLGLHLTINRSAKANAEQVTESKAIVYDLVAEAYSGYIDVQADTDVERFHAKEIAPKIADDIEDIID